MDPMATRGWAGMTLARLGAILLLGAGTALALVTFRAPPSVPAAAGEEAFSAERALEHVRVIAAEVHPVGGEGHRRVRDYLLGMLTKLGLEAQEQRAEVLVPEEHGPFFAGTVHNIIGRLPGSEGKQALVIAAHFDSVPTGPGAADNGAAVGAMLETARALKQGPPLKNDVLFVFTDAEEVGRQGAQAFVAKHPLARKAAVVLNFEARGTSGPAVMFESSTGNGWLVGHLAKVPRPMGNSAHYEIYRAMPNDTDLGLFLREGIAGLNFAFVDDYHWYHTQRDDVRHLDPDSVQHHGGTMLALARSLGDADLTEAKSEDAVYFNLTGLLFIRYPAGWVNLLAIGSALIWVVLISFQVDRSRARWRRVLLAAGLALVLIVLAAALVYGGLKLLSLLRPEYRWLRQAHPYQAGVFMTAFALLVGAAALLLAWLTARAFTTLEAIGGLSLLLLAFTVACAALVPGVSFLFQWPLLALLLAMALLPSGPDDWLAPRQGLVLAIASLPAVLLLVPMVHDLYLGLALPMAWAAAAVGGLACGCALPAARVLFPGTGEGLGQGKGSRPGLLILGLLSLLGAVGVFLFGMFQPSFDEERPRTNGIAHVLDVDQKQAFWVSSDPAADDWTAQWLGMAPESKTMTDYFPMFRRNLLTAKAPLPDLHGPTATVLKDEKGNGPRTVELRIASPRGAPLVQVCVPWSAGLRALTLGGTTLDEESLRKTWAGFGGVVLNYWGAPADGFTLTVRVASDAPLELRINDVTYGLPAEIKAARPAGMIPMPFGSGLTDCTVISRKFAF